MFEYFEIQSLIDLFRLDHDKNNVYLREENYKFLFLKTRFIYTLERLPLLTAL
jgi:hypothetical protein